MPQHVRGSCGKWIHARPSRVLRTCHPRSLAHFLSSGFYQHPYDDGHKRCGEGGPPSAAVVTAGPHWLGTAIPAAPCRAPTGPPSLSTHNDVLMSTPPPYPFLFATPA